MVQNHDLSGFQAEVSGFSGPFDLLCYLVENRQLDAAGISVGQAVRIYGAYLANTRRVSVAVISEFLVLAASLVLNKIRSLLPEKPLSRKMVPAARKKNPVMSSMLRKSFPGTGHTGRHQHFCGIKKKSRISFFPALPQEMKDKHGTSATSMGCAVSGGTFLKKNEVPVLRQSQPGWTERITGKVCLFPFLTRNRLI